MLSDHRYQDSRIVFYRYGGMRMQPMLNVKGEKLPMLTSPNGELIHDQRLAYPVEPAWEAPVLPSDRSETEKVDTLALNNSRYTIEAAITFSSAGGVYMGRDNQTGRKIVVKEARPFINAASDHYDAVDLLKKEYRLLRVLAHTGIAPQPIDLFQEWEHWFLVEEFVEGIAMSHHSAANNILLRSRTTVQEREAWCAMFSNLCAELMRILAVLHAQGIVFGDLSTNNLIVSGDGSHLKIIDFEGAYLTGIDRPARMYTPGFVSPNRIAGGEASWRDRGAATSRVPPGSRTGQRRRYMPRTRPSRRGAGRRDPESRPWP